MDSSSSCFSGSFACGRRQPVGFLWQLRCDARANLCKMFFFFPIINLSHSHQTPSVSAGFPELLVKITFAFGKLWTFKPQCFQLPPVESAKPLSAHPSLPVAGFMSWNQEPVQSPALRLRAPSVLPIIRAAGRPARERARASRGRGAVLVWPGNHADSLNPAVSKSFLAFLTLREVGKLTPLSSEELLQLHYLFLQVCLINVLSEYSTLYLNPLYPPFHILFHFFTFTHTSLHPLW